MAEGRRAAGDEATLAPPNSQRYCLAAKKRRHALSHAWLQEFFSRALQPGRHYLPLRRDDRKCEETVEQVGYYS